MDTSKITPVSKDSKQIGKILKSGTRIVNIDEENDSYTIQCIKCGTEENRNLSLLKSRKDKLKLTLCSRCSTKQPSLAELKKEYLHKVFNGLVIEDIYIDEDTEAVMCDTVCLQGRQNTKLISYLNDVKDTSSSSSASYQTELESVHTTKGLPLGDVINKRCYCKVCGDNPVSKSKKLANRIGKCSVADLAEKSGVWPAIHLHGMKESDFYESMKTGSICDRCAAKAKCEIRSVAISNSYEFIAAALDMEDNLLNDTLGILDSYPSMIQLEKLNPGDIKPIVEKDLIVFKDEYYDKVGRLYRACKCRKHGTELSLSDGEIAAFKHEQCIENNPYMRFFNIQSTIYLNKEKPAKSSKSKKK